MEAPSGRARRQSEMALAAFENKVSALGRPLTLADAFSEIDSEEWSYGFVLAIDPDVERSSLLDYGENFARLLDLPPKARPFVKITRQLPHRYAEVFLRACTAACEHNRPVPVEGEVDCDDGRKELYRAVFIPVQAEGDVTSRFAFGRFNSRTVDP